MFRLELAVEQCHTHTHTHTQEWSETKTLCGGGIQRRRGLGEVVLNRTCNEHPCPDVSCLPGV